MGWSPHPAGALQHRAASLSMQPPGWAAPIEQAPAHGRSWTSVYPLRHHLQLGKQSAASMVQHGHPQELESTEPSWSRSSPTPWDAHLVDGFVASVLQPQVNHGVLQSPPHVELQGEVVNPLKEKTIPGHLPQSWKMLP